MQDGAECLSSTLAYHLFAHLLAKFLQPLLNDLQVAVALGYAVMQAVQGLQDTFLHLGCSLVGKGHGQCMLELLAPLTQQKQDILNGKRECLSCSGRGFVY